MYFPEYITSICEGEREKEEEDPYLPIILRLHFCRGNRRENKSNSFSGLGFFDRIVLEVIERSVAQRLSLNNRQIYGKTRKNLMKGTMKSPLSFTFTKLLLQYFPKNHHFVACTPLYIRNVYEDSPFYSTDEDFLLCWRSMKCFLMKASNKITL